MTLDELFPMPLVPKQELQRQSKVNSESKILSPLEWNTAQVLQWCQSLPVKYKLSETEAWEAYQKQMELECVTGKTLLCLTGDALKRKLKVESLIHRRILMIEIALLLHQQS